MPKNNPYYIPKEYKKVEEVRFWDYKEVKKSPLSVAARSKVISRHSSDYLSSRAINSDIAVSQMYGPGFWDFMEDFMDGAAEVAKFGGKAVGSLAVGSAIAVTGPFAIPIGLGVATEGYLLKRAAKEGAFGNDKVVKEAADFVGECAIGGGSGAALDGTVKVVKAKWKK